LTYLVVGSNGFMGTHLVDRLLEMEVVSHLASTTLPKTSNDDPIYDVRSNLIDTIQLPETCEVGVRRVVFASSVRLPKSEVEAYSVKSQTSGGGGIP